MKLFALLSKFLGSKLKKRCNHDIKHLIFYYPNITRDDPIGDIIGVYCTVCGYDTHGEYEIIKKDI